MTNTAPETLWLSVNNTLAAGDWRGIMRADLEALTVLARRGAVADCLACPAGLPDVVAARVRAFNAAVVAFAARNRPELHEES